MLAIPIRRIPFVIKFSKAQDLLLISETPALSDSELTRFACQLNHGDGTQYRYTCVIFKDFETGWAHSVMLEKLEQVSPHGVRGKLRPLCSGPCIKELRDTAQESSLGFFALYPIVGSPVTTIPESLDISLSIADICVTSLQYLSAMASYDPSTSSTTVYYKANARVDDFMFDVRTKSLWFTNHHNSLLVHQSWSGTSYLSVDYDLKDQLDLPSNNDGSELAALLGAIQCLSNFSNNSAKETGNPDDWMALETFLNSRNELGSNSIWSCIEFFSRYLDSDSDHLAHGQASGYTTGTRGSSLSSSSTSNGNCNGSSTSGNSSSSGNGSSSEPKNTPSVAKYPKAPGANSPLSISQLISSQAAQALAENKSNPIVVVNDLYQRLTGVPPSLKDEGRLGGSDHVPRFGCSFVFPNGESVSSEGSSKQEAKANVALHILEAIAKGSIPKMQR